MISTITSTQKFNAIHPIIRVNATELYVYRLRNTKDLDTFIEEVSAVLDKKTVLQLCNVATSEPHSFLYVKLTATNKNDMFYMNFNLKKWLLKINNYLLKKQYEFTLASNAAILSFDFVQSPP